MKFPHKLSDKLNKRIENNALRQLGSPQNGIDFATNDYLGFANSAALFNETHSFLIERNILQNGATGSRLLTGNHLLYTETEEYIAQFHNSDSALLFNSGYDANLGFFSCVPQKGDCIIYDELIHASIRDGIQLSNANSYKFKHNDVEDLQRLIEKVKSDSSHAIYVVTETVFSMDGDTPPLVEIANLCQEKQVYFIVDEAHALGVFGDKGQGIIQMLEIEHLVFARIITFGKGLGCHGAVILGSENLKTYLVNFARSFIYTTGLSPHSVATIKMAYQKLTPNNQAMQQLRQNITVFNQNKQLLGLKPIFVQSKSAIQCAIVPGNKKVKHIASKLQQEGFHVKPILSPTVPEGQERLRICLHSFNSENEITQLLQSFAQLIF
ncbi:pyridoxal phosphate-dependent aminotransferase family protein [Flavobacterium sp.]|uniref:aminotransferase class I/II-fold pyridoxal phosphate-dependent enzyme n=1 Tax=Flavobacterium sp. TaxID=239 RepID=UPI002617E356|nr:pyridoxal phosphate-dependent aminotransferase family protein [Flavobacterium sp.]MDD3004696.1 pyridoxal phosphate-dependent aminotransferase family protein [Flavobacterium sp.]